MKALLHIYRLIRAGLVVLPHALRALPESKPVPGPLKLLRRTRIGRARESRPGDLSKAVAALGPSYIKLGNSSPRGPIWWASNSQAELASLRDKLPPFPMREARRTISESLGMDSRYSFR